MMLPLTLTGRGWGVLLGSLALWGAWRVAGLRDLWYLVALLASMVALSVLAALLIPLIARPTVRISVSNPTPMVGERITTTAEVRRRLRWISGFRILWGFPDLTITEPIEGRSPAVIDRPWDADRRGLHAVGVSALEFLDPLGLAKRTLRVRATTEILVLPQLIDALTDLLDVGSLRQPSDDESRPSSTIQSSGGPGGTVRSYRTGDARRQIHWKQSARQGELLVNVLERSDQPKRSLMLVTASEAYASHAEFECAVSTTATLAVRSLQAGFSVRLHGQGDSVDLPNADEALRHLALVKMPDARPFSRNDTYPLVHVIVTGLVSPGLAHYLEGVPGESTLVLTSRAAGVAPPPQWKQVHIDGA